MTTKSESGKILIASRADFPVGGGRTQRLMTLARAIRDAGWAVELWIEEPVTGKIQLDWKKQGEIDGIPFFQFSDSGSRRRQLHSLPQRIFRSLSMAWRLLRRKDVALVIFNVPFLYDGLPLAISSRIKGIPCVFAFEDERFPDRTGQRGLMRRVTSFLWDKDQQLCDSWLAPRVSGIVAISDYLVAKYARLGCKNIEKIPTLVTERDWQLGPAHGDCPEFFYAGESTQEIYEFSNMLEAFARLKASGLRFRAALVMGRPEAFPSVAVLQGEVRRLGLDGQVEFIEFMPLQKLKVRMAQATFLLCLRKDTDLARSGASTKLSEYLATGRVVVLTPVGDIACHLRDGVNSIVACDTSTDAIEASFAAALRLTPEQRERLGEGGLELARQLFDPRLAGVAVGRWMAGRRAEGGHHDRRDPSC